MATGTGTFLYACTHECQLAPISPPRPIYGNTSIPVVLIYTFVVRALTVIS
jgi:hypothetical protein